MTPPPAREARSLRTRAHTRTPAKRRRAIEPSYPPHRAHAATLEASIQRLGWSDSAVTDETLACQLTIRGRVQGVFFRDSTRREAQRLGVAGWGINRPHGAV